ncbi:energy transducer TonB [Melittangium boletus]|uniref:energy transducer TonB n=1 Tax=Melittangium boletus TaxID=83453 RepID=UPI003DA22773
MILNFPFSMDETPAESPVHTGPRERLFLMGESPRGRMPGQRWGWAVGVAVLVHVGLLGAGLALASPAVREPEPPKEPELVFFQFAPPPPPAASVTRAARPVQRQARSVPRPVIRPTVPALVVEKRPEPPPVEPVPEAPVEEDVPEPGADAVADAAAVASALDGVLGGVLGGREGGLVGATGGSAVDLKQVARAPRVLEQVRPHYPRRARSEGIEGRVLVRLIIGVDGRVEPDSPRVVESVVALDAAALEAVRQWRFTPALGHQGRPVRVIVEIPVQFTLK